MSQKPSPEEMASIHGKWEPASVSVVDPNLDLDVRYHSRDSDVMG